MPPLHRPYLRQSTREQIQNNAPKDENGNFMYKGEVIQGSWDYGHVYGHENWHEIQIAEKAGMTQEEFNDHINSHPEYFEIQPHDVNISHVEEMSREEHEAVDKASEEAQNAEESQVQSM